MTYVKRTNFIFWWKEGFGHLPMKRPRRYEVVTHNTLCVINACIAFAIFCPLPRCTSKQM